MKAIGGYFELELNQNREYHQKAIKLNAGRNAFEYILRAQKYTKIYLPCYICEVIMEPINKLGLSYHFYNINKDFTPDFDFTQIKNEEAFLYVNYFGICDRQVNNLVNKCKNLIIDNSQAFFSQPIKGISTFYSPRKFFGVSDGAYLYNNKKLTIKLKRDVSYGRIRHLIGRLEENPEKYYSNYQESEEGLKAHPIKKMSKLTEKILKSINL
jgi:hypothetical protein